MSEMTTAERRDADERTWALSVFLGEINLRELERIAKSLSLPDIERFIMVVASFRADLALRDLNQPRHD